MNKINWTAIAIFCLVVVLVFMVGLSLFGGWQYGGWGMMGSGRMGPGMMGRWGFSPFGWIGMVLMWLIPLGVIFLVVAGVVWLVRAIIGAGATPGGRAASAGGATISEGTTLAGQSCPNCGRAVQADWINCPYCGQSLS